MAAIRSRVDKRDGRKANDETCHNWDSKQVFPDLTEFEISIPINNDQYVVYQ
jgi:hypothetical protein